MRTKKLYFKDILHILEELHKLYPTYGVGRHISTALSDYGDLWDVSDKEIHFALVKYKAQLEMDVPRETDEEEINKIIRDGMNLSTLLDDNDSYEGQEY